MQVQERVEQVVKALACEPGAATRLAEDESLSKLFRLVGAEGLVIPSIDWKVHRSQAGKVLPTPFLPPTLRGKSRQVMVGRGGRFCTWCWKAIQAGLRPICGNTSWYGPGNRR